MPVASVTTPPPYSSPSATWRAASATDPILAAVPPPRYDGVVRSCDLPGFGILIDADADGTRVLPWDSVGQFTRVMEGQSRPHPRMRAWTRDFREQLTRVDQITHRMRTDADPVSLNEAFNARAPFPISCTPEMHAAISAYYEALDAFLVRLPELLSADADHNAHLNATPRAIASNARAAGATGVAGTVSDGHARQLALARLTAAARDLDAQLGALPKPAWRPSMVCTSLSLLGGVGGLVAAIALPPMSPAARRPSDLAMVLRVMASFVGFMPFFILSTRRAYLDNSDGEALRQLKSHIADVQTELNRFATLARIEIAGIETTSATQSG